MLSSLPACWSDDKFWRLSYLFLMGLVTWSGNIICSKRLRPRLFETIVFEMIEAGTREYTKCKRGRRFLFTEVMAFWQAGDGNHDETHARAKYCEIYVLGAKIVRGLARSTFLGAVWGQFPSGCRLGDLATARWDAVVVASCVSLLRLIVDVIVSLRLHPV